MAEKDPGLIKSLSYNWRILPRFTKVAAVGYVALITAIAAFPTSNDNDENAVKAGITPWGQIDKSVPQKRVGYSWEAGSFHNMDGIDTDMRCYYEYDEPSNLGITKSRDSYDAGYVKEDRPASWTVTGDYTVNVHSHINGERMDNTYFVVNKDGTVNVDQSQGVLGRPYAGEPEPQAETYMLNPGDSYTGTAGMVNYALGRYSKDDNYYTVSMWCNKPGTDVIMGGLNDMIARQEAIDSMQPIDPFYPFGY